MNKDRLEIEDMPELDTKVGLAGAMHQQEVGGPVCLGVIAAVVVYNV